MRQASRGILLRWRWRPHDVLSLQACKPKPDIHRSMPNMCTHLLLLLLLAPLGATALEPPDEADTAKGVLSDRFLKQAADLGLWGGTAACSSGTPGGPVWQVRRFPPPPPPKPKPGLPSMPSPHAQCCRALCTSSPACRDR